MGVVADGGKFFERRRRTLGRRLLGASLGLIGALVLPAGASAIDEFPLPAGTKPGGITAGPDGALWFTEENTYSIGRITTTGAYSHYPLPPNQVGQPADQITLGPDGKLWYTETGSLKIGVMDPANPSNPAEYPINGQTSASPQGITVAPDRQSLWFTEFDSHRIHQIHLDGTLGTQVQLPAGALPSDIASADGKLWFTESGRNKIGSYDPASGGSVIEYPAGTGQTGGEPSSIIATAGGILWFTEFTGNAIGRLTAGGLLTEYPGTGAGPSGIAAASDGALWFTESGANSIGRITSGGTYTNHFLTPTQPSEPSDITLGPDGALWFSEFSASRIGRIQTAPAAPPPPPPPPPVVTLSVSSLRLSPSSFKAAPNGASITKKAKGGTTVTYSISAAASTKFTVESVQTGRKSGKKCVKPKRGKSGKKCTRYVVVGGSFKHAGKAGRNKFRFSGRVGGKKLAPGKYRLVAVATVGARQSKLKRADFKIVR